MRQVGGSKPSPPTTLRRGFGWQATGLSILGIVLFTLLFTGPAGGAELAGEAGRVRDGDTLELGGVTLRLHGYDAPETGRWQGRKWVPGGQRCAGADGACHDCGEAARAALEDLVGGRRLVCRLRDESSYRRAIARCRVGELDVSLEMVRLGHGLPYWRYITGERDLRAFGRALTEAVTARRGMHAGAFVPPWDWRKGARLEACQP